MSGIPDFQSRALDLLERGGLNEHEESWLLEMSERTTTPTRQHFGYLSALECGIQPDAPPLAGSTAGGWA